MSSSHLQQGQQQHAEREYQGTQGTVAEALEEIESTVRRDLEFKEQSLKRFDEHIGNNLSLVDDLNQLIDSMRMDREKLESVVLPALIEAARDLQSVFHAIEVVEELMDEIYRAAKNAADRLQALQDVENSRRPKGFSKVFRSFKFTKSRSDIQPLEVPNWNPNDARVNVHGAFEEIDELFGKEPQHGSTSSGT
eukprot:gb/GECG01007036.1/.p1 GENE.gb/GECG01007036.1/~~gb/GECG01007036.1/.p1  ORF type:complete len:194 (+),score=38.34 gb/GECG01007036.1/:1-582(+)